MTPAEALAALARWAAILRIPDLETAATVLRDAIPPDEVRILPPHDECPLWPPEDPPCR